MSAIKKHVLGDGCYGTVYLAENFSYLSFSPVSYFFDSPGSFSPESPLYAVKTSKPERSKFLKVEGEYLKALSHSPYVLNVYGDDISVENGRRVYNLLLEYAPGGTLGKLIQSSGNSMLQLQECEASWYAYQILKGLRDVHSRGIAHRDLKTDNVLVFPCRCGCGFDRVKLADFGLAKSVGDSPTEQWMYAEDIWAVGCMVIEMFIGFQVWNSNDVSLIRRNIEAIEPEMPEHISVNAQDFLKRCFEKDHERWTADALLAHPFVANGINESSKVNIVEARNPFGQKGWDSYRDLFSGTIIPEF